MRSLLLIGCLVALFPWRALAGPETVATIAPVHSLVARVMEGAGAPHLLVPPDASPHQVALRPSDAAALARADLVFRVGPAIEPWIERPLATLAAEARVVRLDQVPGLTRLPLRGSETFAHGAHGAEHGHAEEDGAPPAAAGHAEGTEDEIDPHFWLDPQNAQLWLDTIAAALAMGDPANAALYRQNAAAALAEIAALEAEIAEKLAPLRGQRFVVFHDAYGYFEHRFDLEAAGAVALSDARTPGPARIARVRALIELTGATCVFREPQFRPALAETVAEGMGARVGVLDPTGAGLEPGPGLYPALLRRLADGLADCLG